MKPSANNSRLVPPTGAVKRAVIYARVSTQEQTKGQYPSCESQIEELEAFCAAQGWQVVDSIKDGGHRAGTLKRPGLTRLRALVESNQVDVVACTWYNRLIGSRDFYILDKEFQAHGVTFTTIHDPADRNTAAGRLLESMLVTIKTFENEQVAEKVRTKLRMRAEKGLWNGGNIPFGFLKDEKTGMLLPDPDKAAIIRQVFEIYVKTSSDIAVRDWLKAHQVTSPLGKPEWVPGAIRKLLMNRRYIGEIELNRDRKGLQGLSEQDSHRIIPAPHAPIISRELYDLAQAIRANGGREHSNRGGKGKGHSQSNNRCQRIYTLQGLLVCGVCGHAMSPHYVHHKPTPKNGRKQECFIYHYCCAQKMKYRKACDHSNRVQAKIPEAWILEQMRQFVDFGGVVEKAMEVAYSRQFQNLEPTREAFAACRGALDQNQRAIDELLSTASNAGGALLELLSEKAHRLKMEREKLRMEYAQLSDALAPLNDSFDSQAFHTMLSSFAQIAKGAEAEELQRIMRLVVRQLQWQPKGDHMVDFFLPGYSDQGKSSRLKKLHFGNATTSLAPLAQVRDYKAAPSQSTPRLQFLGATFPCRDFEPG